MKVAGGLACVALGGCHWLFQLNDLHAPPDGSTIDAPEDPRWTRSIH
jgi:hypothetical protein